MVEMQDYYLEEISIQDVDIYKKASFMSHVTDFTLLLAFMSFVVPEIRLSLSGPTYETGYPRISELLGLLSGVCAVCEVICSGGRLRFSTLHGVLLVHLVVAYIFGEAIYSVVKTGGRGNFRSGELIPIVIFMLISQLNIDSKRTRKLLVRFVISQVLVAVTLYAQRAGLFVGFFHWASQEGSKRLFGFGYDATQTTYGLATAFVVTLGLVWSRWNKVSCWIGYIVMAFLLGAILLTLTRIAPVAIIFAAGVMLYGQRYWALRGILISIILFFLTTVVVFFLGADLTRFYDPSVGYARLVPWRDAFLIGLKFPFGTGTGSYADLALSVGISVSAHPQNDFFYAFATQGWLAAGILVVIYWLLIRLVLSVRKLNTTDSQMWFRCFGGTLMVWLMFGMAEICFTIYLFNGPLFVIMAICFGYLNSPISADSVYQEEYSYEPQS